MRTHGITPKNETAAAQADRGILVACQARNDDLDSNQLNIFSQARVWADKLGAECKVWGFLMGPAKSAQEHLGGRGIEKIYNCPQLDLTVDPGVKARTAARLATRLGAQWVFMLHSGATAELGPRLGALLNIGLVSRCVGLEIDGHNRIHAYQSLHMGRLGRKQLLPPQSTHLVSWSPEAIASTQSSAKAMKQAYIQVESESAPKEEIRFVSLEQGDPRTVPLSDAERIIAMGRGMLPGGMDLVQKAADLLAAAVGGTRPVVDAEVMPFARQIGQTGVSVAPRLLITAGISGANEFTVGVKGAGRTIAINTDPRARVFQMADLGLVGDAAEILNQLLDRLADSQTGQGVDQP